MNATFHNTHNTECSRSAVRALRLSCATLGLLVLLVSAACVSAQSGQFSGQNFPHSRVGQDPMTQAGSEEIDPVMQAKRINALNADRQKSLINDTNKLVKLVAELNAEINGAPPSSLSDDQIKKLAEIEKLAHNIREKMSASINGIPQVNPSTTLIPPAIQ